MNTLASTGDARSAGRAFSLVEMLAVIAVLAIVAAATLPVVTSMTKGSTRRAAVAVVVSVLDQARGLAVSNSSTHYLAFADTNKQWPANLRCRTFAIFQEVFNPAGNRYDRLIVTPWTELPQGVAFDPGADLNDRGVFSATDAKVKVFCKPAGAELELPCFKFNSLGGLEAPADSADAVLRLFEGTINADGKAVREGATGKLRDEIVQVSTVTGRARRVNTDDGTPAPTPTP